MTFDTSLHPRARGGRFGLSGHAHQGGANIGFDEVETAMLSVVGGAMEGKSAQQVLQESDDPEGLLRQIAAKIQGGAAREHSNRRFKRDASYEAQFGDLVSYEAGESTILNRGDDEGEDDFEARVDGERHKLQKDGSIVLQATIPDDLDESALREGLMSSLSEDHRNQPSWMKGPQGRAERKSVQSAVDEAIAGYDLEGEEGGVLHVVIPRPDDSLYHRAKEAAAQRLQARGVPDGQIQRHLSGEADEDRADAQSASRAASTGKHWDSSEGALKAAYPDEYEAMIGETHQLTRVGARERLTRRYEKEFGRSPGEDN